MSKKRHYMTIFEFDSYIIEKCACKKPCSNIALFYPNYVAKFSDFYNSNITVIEHKDLSNTLRNNMLAKTIECNKIPDDIMSNIPISKFDYIIFNRIIEHIPYDEVDYLIYCLYQMLRKDGEIIVTYPDMIEVTNKIKECLERRSFTEFKFYNIEMFNEGSFNDLHKLFTTPDSILYYFTEEGLFTHKYTSSLFSIGTNRKIYRYSVFKRK